MARNLAERYSPNVDERFEARSYAREITNNRAHEWDGVETVKVYSMPVAPLNDYDVNASGDVYGPATLVERSVQTMTVGVKKAFNMKIDKLANLMDKNVSKAGEQLARQINQVVIPFYDHYIYNRAATAAIAHENAILSSSTTNTAYKQLLEAQERLGNNMVPTRGRIAVCSWGFYNKLKHDNSFILDTESSQRKLDKGVLGEVDGLKVQVVPNGLLPAGCSAIVAHPSAMTAPEKLRDYIIHDCPPGWSGWKLEGLVCFDAFVLDNKANGIFYIGASGVNKAIQVSTMPVHTTTKTKVTVMSPADEGHTWKWATGTKAYHTENGQTPVAEATWTALTTNGDEITPTGGNSDTILTVVELDGAGKVVGEGATRINFMPA